MAVKVLGVGRQVSAIGDSLMFKLGPIRAHLESAGTILLTCLAFSLPFEAKRPILSLGFAQITSVELPLYLFLAVWGIGWAAGTWRSWSACHSAVAFWALVIALSAVFAPVERAAAFKFALRSLGGCALFFAAADFSASFQRVRNVAIALVAGASISAIAGGAEIAWPSAARLLGVFKTQPSLVGGFLRASGTFQYANIAAMYWEAAAPLCLVLALVQGRCGKRSRLMWLYLAGVLILVEGVMLSMSRAAIVLGVLMLIVCLALARSAAAVGRAVIWACLLVTLAPLVCHLLFAGSFRLRMTAPRQSSWYRVDYAGSLNSLTLRPRQAFLLPVKIRNLGAMVWNSEDVHPIALSYHWEDPDRRSFAVWDGMRTPLPFDVPPGNELGVNVRIRAPGTMGRYILHLDMVQEGVTWFSLQGSPALRILADVRTPVSQEPEEEPGFDYVRPELVRVAERGDLWRAALGMWKDHPFLGVGPDNFRHIYGPYLGWKKFDTRNHSNSLYFETLATMGTVGLAALAALFIPFAAVIRRRLRQPACAEEKLLLLGIGASIALYFLHGIVDYFLEFSPTYAFFWLALGMAAGLARSKTIS
jgi:hypothetical protein